MTRITRIALIDWDIHVRLGRKFLIESNETFKVVFEGKGSLLEIQDLSDSLIDILVIDHRLESISGIEFVGQLRSSLPNAKELPGLLLTAPYDSPSLRVSALEAGFDALVSLEEGPEALLGALNLISSSSFDYSLLSLFELLSRAKTPIEPDPQLATNIESLSNPSAKLIEQLQKAWLRMINGTNNKFELASLVPVVSELGLRTKEELVLKLYKGGLLREI